MEGQAEAASLAIGAAPAGRLGGALAWLRDAFEAERDRWFLWLPAFLGSGAGLYFTLTVEPPLWLGLATAPLALLLALVARRVQRFTLLTIALAAVAVGFAGAELETWAAAAPVLERRLGPVPVEGRVVEAEPLPAGTRILVEPTRIGRLAPDRLPARIRIKLRDGTVAPVPGEGIALRATLLPPRAPTTSSAAPISTVSAAWAMRWAPCIRCRARRRRNGACGSPRSVPR